MKRLQAFKFVLRPSGEQQRLLRCYAGSCRFVFNKALGLQKERYERGEQRLGYAGLCALLTTWKSAEETAWLGETPSQALQQALKDLERAYKNFFEKRSDFPRFKKKGQRDSFRYPQGCKLDEGNARVFLPKLGWMRYRKSHKVAGTLKNVTVSYASGQWFVSIQTEIEVETPVHLSVSMVGIDLGVARLATLSDKTVIEPVHSFKRHAKALAKAQRALSHKQKFSANWQKAKAKVSKQHQKIAAIRKDTLHKATTSISKNHAMICLEDLQIGNMTKSAKGTRDNPGKQVKAKSGLNKAILDQGWFEFRRQLEYKQAWRGGVVLLVPPHYTSQTCPACRYVAAANRKTQAAFVCVSCGFSGHADWVAAVNILERGHRLLACGDGRHLAPSVKQEPAEVLQAKVA